jgi:hypothetical protein
MGVKDEFVRKLIFRSIGDEENEASGDESNSRMLKLGEDSDLDSDDVDDDCDEATV